MNFNSVVNTHEHSVFNEVLRLLNEHKIEFNEDQAEDIACLALNDLPPHYVRHSVDTAYFQTKDESREITQQVAQAVEKALLRVQAHPRTAES